MKEHEGVGLRFERMDGLRYLMRTYVAVFGLGRVLRTMQVNHHSRINGQINLFAQCLSVPALKIGRLNDYIRLAHRYRCGTGTPRQHDTNTQKHPATQANPLHQLLRITFSLTFLLVFLLALLFARDFSYQFAYFCRP